MEGSRPAEPKEAPLLSIRNLRTIFETEEGVVRAVDGVSFDLARSASLGIVGESGSGKSVLNLSIMGLIPSPPGRVVSGEVLFDGVDLLRLPPRELRDLRGKRISMIFQDPMTSLNPFLRISRQLTEVLEVHLRRRRFPALYESVRMLERVGIPAAADRIFDYPHQFSGGMRQRVMIAMGLLCRPELLIADEPTTALDVTIQAQILDLVKEIKEKLETAVIVITHDLGVVAGMCEEIAVMYAGRIVEYGPVRRIFHHPQHPYTLGLLRSVPRVDARRRARLVPIRGAPPDLTRLPPGCPFAPRCDFAMTRCREAYPPEREPAAGHRVHCWVENPRPPENETAFNRGPAL